MHSGYVGFGAQRHRSGDVAATCRVQKGLLGVCRDAHVRFAISVVMGWMAGRTEKPLDTELSYAVCLPLSTYGS